MINSIHIFGASGAGTTTLGKALSDALGFARFDTDDYYWEIKYTQSRPVEKRLAMIREDISALSGRGWILSGQLTGWGNPLIPLFDLAVFLYVPPEIRLARLKDREIERYGDRILEGGDHYQHHKEFMDWAADYDSAGMEIRSRHRHEQWMKKLPCQLLRIEENLTAEASCNKILSIISK